MRDHIVIKGARENNLKNIDVEIPRDALVVMTGLSGSGKSSLAFDTIFAEGQRRYMESLSSYARQFLGQMDKPDVDSIDGMSPAISIDQKTTSKNPRSTVGTVTEIYDYLRLLWARVGVPHCPKCGKEIRRQTVDQLVDQRCGATALPHDGVIDGLAAYAVPHHRGLALVGDTDGGNAVRMDAALKLDLHHHADLAGKHLRGILLHPAGAREAGFDATTRLGDDAAVLVDDGREYRGGAAVERHDVGTAKAKRGVFHAQAT